MTKYSPRAMTNTEPVSKEALESFTKHVLAELALSPVWQMEWTTAGDLCEKTRHIIFVDEDIVGQCFWRGKERVLHEVAHVFIDDRLHSSRFYAEYVKLLSRFMVSGWFSKQSTWRNLRDLMLANEGLLVVVDAVTTLVGAGVFPGRDLARGSIYSSLDHHKKDLVKVRAGVYRLVKTEKTS